MGEPKKKPRGRLSGLRFKKKDIPGGLWLKCPSCDTTIYRKELEAKGHTCPSCSFHFTVPGRERVAMTLDPGTWNEMFADLEASDRLGFTDAISYSEKIARTVEKSGEKEGLLCGTGDILGRPVVLAVLDFKFLGGSMGEVVGEKVSLATDVARVRNLPLILFTSSGGARMHEGMLSLMQMAKTCSALAEFNSAGGFSICVQTNPTTGGVTASFASVCDLTLAEPGALIGFAGPRVIKTTIKQELPPGFQRAEFLLERGQVDSIIAREDLVGMLAKLIDFGVAGRPSAPAPDSTGEELGSDEASDEDSSEGTPDADAELGEAEQTPPSAPEAESGDAIPRPEQA
ncbi:MAG TPA: acetyl-CoA carboxylase, carboxyltransferase subunit beta [Planctomycetes bacterium]|nr:acetyl-CoA carboxylase, carboxyltransferase subunit beta [Planctomycetota bacterium]HIK59992.1 acetyl-CoA carboxylase, carboxyltransferase subunit beta [Planctomycetota bacterium]